jgi:hypothetical protein
MTRVKTSNASMILKKYNLVGNKKQYHVYDGDLPVIDISIDFKYNLITCKRNDGVTILLSFPGSFFIKEIIDVTWTENKKYIDAWIEKIYWLGGKMQIDLSGFGRAGSCLVLKVRWKKKFYINDRLTGQINEEDTSRVRYTVEILDQNLSDDEIFLMNILAFCDYFVLMIRDKG